MLKIYLARGMTGRIKADVVKEAKADKKWFEAAGISVLDPVAAEGVKASKQKLLSSKAEMDKHWKRDKQMIAEAHVLLDMTPNLNSEGVKHELGFGRYHLWKPVVRVFPYGQLPSDGSVARYEDDYICDSREEALEYLLRVHGTWKKRLLWKARLLNRCLLSFLWVRIKWLWEV